MCPDIQWAELVSRISKELFHMKLSLGHPPSPREHVLQNFGMSLHFSCSYELTIFFQSPFCQHLFCIQAGNVEKLPCSFFPTLRIGSQKCLCCSNSPCHLPAAISGPAGPSASHPHPPHFCAWGHVACALLQMAL